MERVMVNTVLQYLRKNDVMSQSAALDIGDLLANIKL